jgi:2-methylcitrate dehydratase PrpD
VSDYLDSLAEFATSLEFRTLPVSVQRHAHYVVVDTAAAIAAGSVEPEVRALAGRYGAEQGVASIIGTGRSTSAPRAALLNGTAGTFLEMDEGNRFSRGHPSIHVVPAALAYAEENGTSGAELMSSIVVGYEVAARIGAAANLRGTMHPHGTWGTVGAAAAIGRLARLDATKMRECLNVASSLTTATSKRTMLEGGMVRNVYAGISNQMGLLALTLIESGINGERDGVASVFGTVVSDRFDKERVVAGLGDLWEISRNYFKLHACCRYNHGALDALDRLEAQGGLPAPERIRSVHVTSYLYAAELSERAPANTLAAKFSVPFAVATRLVNRSSRLPSFTWDAVRDPRVRELARRVAVLEDPAMTARLPDERPARVEIALDDGSRLTAEVGANRGDDTDPYERRELEAKWTELLERAWPPANAKRIEALLLHLADAQSLSELSTAFRAVTPRG